MSPDRTFALTLDASGLQCPLPVLKARKALLNLAPGQRLMVTATDPLAALDFQHFCSQSGNRLVAHETHDGRHVFVIERA